MRAERFYAAERDVGPAVTGDLQGRVALLTGASGGIGQAIGRRLAEEGVDVCLSYGRHGDDAEAVAAYARELAGGSPSSRRHVRPEAPPALVARAVEPNSAPSTCWSPTQAPPT